MRASVVLVILAIAGTAHADPKGDIEKKIKAAMESYDLMDYDAAKKSLNQALAAAKKSKLDKDAVAARAYLDLGIVAFVNNDPDAAKLSFLSAVQIQPKIQIEAAYKSADIAKLLEEARKEAKGSGGGGGEEAAAEPAEDCTGVKGLDHQIIDTAKAGAPLAVEAKVGPDVKSSKVSVMFRAGGATEYTEIKMKKEGCKYVANIPASGMRGGTVQYYVAAYGEGPKPVASKGSSGSPNIIEITGTAAATAAKDDNEDPINGGKKTEPAPKKVAEADAETSSSGEVDKGASTSGPSKTPRVLLTMAAGMGGGVISGCMTACTEGQNPVRSSGLGPSLLVLTPELAYFVNPHISIGAAARIGLPIDANYSGHATAAPSVLGRFRYHLSTDGEGITVLGEVGYGIIRNTVDLQNSMPGQNTDIYASGPLLVGAGVGYSKRLAGSVMFVADASVLGAVNIGGADMMGNSTVTGFPLNSALNFDVALGFALGL